MNAEKLKKLQESVRIGGKGTPRRKKKVIHQTATTDDKKLQASLKKLAVNTIPGIEEVNMIKNDGSVIHFNNPKAQASLAANTFAISGHGENKQIVDMLPGILTQLGPEGLNHLKRLANDVVCNEKLLNEEDDVPELVENFEEVADKEATVEGVTKKTEQTKMDDDVVILPNQCQWYLDRLGLHTGKWDLKDGYNTIGRSKKSPINLQSPFSSRTHCTIKLCDGKLTLKDVSTNGTFINGEEVLGRTCEIFLGDIIAIGGNMEIDDCEYRSDTFIFRLCKEAKEADNRRRSVEFEEYEQPQPPPPAAVQVKVEEIPEVPVVPDPASDEEDIVSSNIRSQMLDVLEIKKEVVDEGSSDGERNDREMCASPDLVEYIDLISDDEEDVRMVNRWLSKLSQSQHNESLKKIKKEKPDEVVTKECSVRLSPLKWPISQRYEESESEDEILPFKRRRQSVFSPESSPVRSHEETTQMDISDLDPVDPRGLLEPIPGKSYETRGRKPKEPQRRKSTSAIIKDFDCVKKEVMEKVASTSRKPPEVIPAPIKYRRNSLRGFCAGELGKVDKKVSLTKVLQHKKEKTVPEIIRQKEIKNSRREVLKNLTPGGEKVQNKMPPSNAPAKVKMTRQNRGSFLAEPLPQSSIRTRRMSCDALMEKANQNQQNEHIPRKIVNRRKTVHESETMVPRVEAEDEQIFTGNIYQRGQKRRIAHKPKVFEDNISPVRENVDFDISPENVDFNISPEPARHTKITFADPLVESREFCPSPVSQLADEDLLCKTMADVLKEMTKWNPDWLKAANQIEVTNHILHSKPLLRLSTTFDSFNSYIGEMIPLLLLDVWSQAVQNQENKSYANQKADAILVSVTAVTSQDEILTITAMIISKPLNMNAEDLVVLRGQFKSKSVQFFAYARTINVESTHSLVTFETSNMSVDNSVVDTVFNVGIVINIKRTLKTFENVFKLENSSLCDTILDPSAQRKQTDYYPYQLKDPFVYCGSDDLDAAQMQIFETVYTDCVNPQSTISMIQGAAGTGKSRIVANLVFQLLLQDNAFCPDKKILNCAPTNAGVDEITMKLLEIKKRNYKYEVANITRYGMPETLHQNVKSISLDEKGKNLIENMIKHRDNPQRRGAYQRKLKKMEDTLKEMATTRKEFLKGNNFFGDTPAQKLKNLNAEMKYLRKKIDDLRRYFKGENFGNTFVYDQILERSNIICTTLSSCCNLANFGVVSFDYCIIDASTQSYEPLMLAPLQYCVSSLVLVGDMYHKAATVSSMDAKNNGLAQSLFHRLSQTNVLPIEHLHKQYRMHPEIFSFPKKYFYKNEVQDCPMDDRSFPWKPYGFFSLEYTKNSDEITFLTSLLRVIATKANPKEYSYGIITPYSHNIPKLKEKTKDISKDIVITTMVDGKDSCHNIEQDITIFWMEKKSGVNFLANHQRLNSILTRTRKCLYVCGYKSTIQQTDIGNRLIKDAEDRNVFHMVTTLNESVLRSFITK